MNQFSDYIGSVRTTNREMVGRTISIHWDSLERLLESAYKAGSRDALKPLRDAQDSMPDFMQGLFNGRNR